MKRRLFTVYIVSYALQTATYVGLVGGLQTTQFRALTGASIVGVGIWVAGYAQMRRRRNKNSNANKEENSKAQLQLDRIG